MENKDRFKFRLWIVEHKKMGDWETVKKECDRLSILHLDGFIPMQCTGNRKDKNDKLIYEGDIVDWQQAEGGILPPNSKPYRCQIIWGDWQQEAFNCKRIDKEDSCLTFNPEFMEVIGNIYENPELLNNK